MKNYLNLYEDMQACGLISGKWKNLLKLIAAEIGGEKDAELALLELYFSLVDDGNLYLPLDRETAEQKLNNKIENALRSFSEDDAEKTAEARATLDAVAENVREAMDALPALERLPVVGETKLFLAQNGKLYTRKFFHAKCSIAASIARLFRDNPAQPCGMDIKTAISPGFQLSERQEEIVNKGCYNNLLVTGGPGTGKTTSVFFLLLALLRTHPNDAVYLAAPSGKAAARMKESILSSIPNVTEAFRQAGGERILAKIKALEEYTIHRLLNIDPATNGFRRNLNDQFPENSIFVIDEASMIDVCLFASLLEALPDGARLFIMGDKNQLPSVECGSVFRELLEHTGAANKVELNQSKRFGEETDIFALAEAINRGEPLPVRQEDWRDAQDFRVPEDAPAGKTPIYYYNDDAKPQTEMVDRFADGWYAAYYRGLKALATDLSPDEPARLDEIYGTAEKARILCANNEGTRGTRRINQKIRKEHFGKKTSGYYPGELLMITKNNKSLDLYNGDCGVAVTFSGDETLYVMFKKSAELNYDEGKQENRIFRLGEYLFYPLRVINAEDITSAFAITIHKSQGSDYRNILVILPRTYGHPMLNRQIVYTAVTRTKGNTVILSNQANLECARDHVLTRDTGIFD